MTSHLVVPLHMVPWYQANGRVHMHTSPAGMAYQWYCHLVQYTCTMVPPVLYHGT